MAYFASPYNSDRAKAFRAAYAKAPMGQDFMFENQPYARSGPPGLLAEEGSGTATGYVEKPFIPESDRAYMSPAMLAEIAAKANRKRLGERIGGRSKVLRDRPVWDHFEKRWVEPEGSFAQSPHGLDALEEDAINARYASGPYNAPNFAAANQMGPAGGYNHQMVNAPMGFGMSGPGQDTGPPSGLLSEPGVDSKSRASRYTDEHGWTKDKRMRDANLQMANLLLNYGEQSRNDGWDSELTHY
jgi:hypothetical protein